MIELRLNGAPLPATLAVGITYRISVIVNGAEVIPSSWSVTTGSGQVAYGFGSFIEFSPATPVAHTISARAVGEFGLFQDVAQTVNAASTIGQAEAGVNWEKLIFVPGEDLSAKIIAKDSRGVAPSRIIWTLYRNGHGVFAGEGSGVRYTGTMSGLYRLRGTAYCYDGSQLAFDSTAFVQGSVNVLHSLPVPQYEGTAIYIGAVYTQNVAAAGGTATSLPYQLASSTEDIFLLPGTTHWTFDLDPDMSNVDDEVVVRTPKGNWCLNGLGGGLTGESVGYDYGYMPTFIPAPVDYRIRLTADFFKVHGVAYAGFNCRVRIKCWRVLPGGIYRYERCPCGSSAHPGGQGRRTRRFAVLFTKLDMQTDVSSGLNRLGTGNAVVPYTTVNTTTVPLMTLSTSGTPNPVPGYSGLFFTDSNLYAYYEVDSQQDISAKAISAIEDVRPCCITLLAFNNSKPLIHNRVKRVYGKAALFLTDGAVFQGSVAYLRIHTWKDNSPFIVVRNGGTASGKYDRQGSWFSKPYYGFSPFAPGQPGLYWDGTAWIITDGTNLLYTSSEDVATPDLVEHWDILTDIGQPHLPLVDAFNWQIPITQDHYVDSDTVIVNIGDVDVDLSDYQFDETGLVVDVAIDEANAVTSPIPTPVPTPIVGPDYIYSTVHSRTVVFDGACYVNPVYTPTLDDNAVTVSPVGGCHDPICGLAAEYCYSSVDAPAENVIIPQPFGFPAPFVSFGSNPARCFANPVTQPAGLSFAYGTYTALEPFNGTSAVDLWTFTGSELCGYSYLYNSCQPSYGYGATIIVVFPVSSSPHTTLEYAGRCYSFAGSTTDYGTRPLVGAVSTNPVADCYDPACNQFNASGSVVVYNDRQTGLEVPVRFDYLDTGTAHYGVVKQIIDDWEAGLVEGHTTVNFKLASDALIYTSIGTGSMMFEFQLPGVRKQIVRDRSGVQTVYSPGIGGSRQIVDLLPGDKVYLRITDAYGRLPLQFRNRRVPVRWHPLPFLPRLYETATVDYAGSTSIKALGFCSYTAQGVYSFYGTLPFNGSMTGPVNPDSLVTVTAQDGQEYNLLTVRATGDVNLFPLTSLPWYSGQALVGPFTFKFYAAREAFGAHGEMDVWFDTDGTFPTYLRAGSYEALELTGTFYRKDGAATDTLRNSYAVATAAEVVAIMWPYVYVDQITGQIVTANVNVPSISL